MTDKQREVYDAIKKFIRANGYSPSVRDLCFLTDRSSPATINHHLKNLKELGYISYIEHRNRTIHITKEIV